MFSCKVLIHMPNDYNNIYHWWSSHKYKFNCKFPISLDIKTSGGLRQYEIPMGKEFSSVPSGDNFSKSLSSLLSLTRSSKDQQSSWFHFIDKLYNPG